jgi:hypothetical protein
MATTRGACGADNIIGVMKILFLDIDGVLNCATSNFSGNGFPIDPYMAILVDRIIQATGCKVVLSSSWKHHPRGIEEVSRFVPIIDKTGDEPGIRGNEIKAWLDRQEVKSDFFVSRYAILDDDSDMLPDQPLFKTSWKEGLTQEIANKVIEHLNS